MLDLTPLATAIIRDGAILRIERHPKTRSLAIRLDTRPSPLDGKSNHVEKHLPIECVKDAQFDMLGTVLEQIGDEWERDHQEKAVELAQRIQGQCPEAIDPLKPFWNEQQLSTRGQ